MLSTNSVPECLREHFIKGKTLAPCGDSHFPPRGSWWDTLSFPRWDGACPAQPPASHGALSSGDVRILLFPFAAPLEEFTSCHQPHF